MNWRPRTWMIISLLCFAAAWVFWHLGERRRAAGSPPPATAPKSESTPSRWSSWLPGTRSFKSAPADPRHKPFALIASGADPRFPFRLSNTTRQGDAIFRSETAILLRHAHYDTADGPLPAIPAHLRAGPNPGSYIVQVRGVIDVPFRDALHASGAAIVSYIPNNAYLVVATPDSAAQIARDPRTQAVLPFEPYYKLSSSLIGDAVNRVSQAPDRELNIVLFPGGRPRVDAQLAALGAETLAEQRSPFGPVLTVRAGGESFITLAQMPEVQLVELSKRRVLMNDLARTRVGVSSNSIAPANFLGLTGTGIRIAINDSGVQGTHGDLAGRIIIDGGNPGANADGTGHGTHVAGTVAGSGAGSGGVTVTNGTILAAQVRGMAHAARLYPQNILGLITDEQLQTNAARTNIIISCNAWGRTIYEYDISSASWDAATRDAWQQLPGDQQTTYVFSAGNDGNGNAGGFGGVQSSITSPGNAKNVITVGAIEQERLIISTNGFLDGGADSRDQVADFSSRGNVGPGVEGPFGRFKPDVVAPGTFVLSCKESSFVNPFPQLAALDAAMNPSGTYRFESGTSMAAAVVSGMLALMQQYFTAAPYSRTNSPALNKALLINGTRSVNGSYNRQVNNQLNYQGWGLVQFTNSIPSNNVASSAIQFVDQSPTNAVATGDVRVYRVTINNPTASLQTNFPLRVSLVWTDPPGNPAAGPKLVNDLDLVVSNSVSGTNIFVYEGNNIAGSDFTSVSTPGSARVSDILNNVENVFIQAPLPANVFDIYVIGRRVNVNAVTGNTNGIVQDFALVVSTDYPNSIALAQQLSFVTNTTLLNVTNGLPLIDQRVGANFQTSNVPNGLFTSVGSTNQWRFYVFSNLFIPAFTNITTNFFVGTTNFFTNVVRVPITNGSNVAFSLVLPPNLSRPRRSAEADIDLYVTRGDPTLTNLSPTVISNCLRGAPGYFASTNRGGSESIIFSPATPADVFYIGVKSEDQQGASFALSVISTDQPFASTNANGGITVNFFPVPMDIPDGSPDSPSGITLFGICPTATNISSIRITNVLVHENLGDLVGRLGHNGIYVTLNNHSIGLNTAGGYVTNTLVYDDYLNPTDGPEFITDFVGQNAIGLWTLTFVDSALEHTGRVDRVNFTLSPSTNQFTNTVTLFSNQCTVQFVDVPVGATNLIINVQQVSSSGTSVDFFVGYGYTPTAQSNDFSRLGVTTNFTYNINTLSSPPLRPGVWFVQICNTTPNTNQVTISFTLEFDYSTTTTITYDARAPTVLLDDYRTNVYITNLDNRVITGVEVGMEIDTPMGSDYAVYLVSPALRKVLLFENRGGTNGGIFANFTEDTNKVTVVITNLAPVGYQTFPTIVPIKWIRPPFTNLLSPPQFVNSNLHSYGLSSSDSAFGMAFLGNQLVIAGQLTNGQPYSDGQYVAYRTPVTNNAVSRLSFTNWPGPLGGLRNGDSSFGSAAITTEGMFLAGVTRDYFPTPQTPSGGASPDIYDLDTGCTNGTLTITYQFFTVPDQMTVYYQGVLLTNTGFVSNGPASGPFPPQTFSINYAGSNSFVRIIMNEFSGNTGTAWNYSVSVSCATFPLYSWATVAGLNGSPGYVDAAGAAARFTSPGGVALDTTGLAYIADTLNHRLRNMTTVGNVTFLAGTGVPGFFDGPVGVAMFNTPRGLVVSNNAAVFVADELNHRIRRVSGGAVSTFAGSTAGFANGPAAAAQFQSPYDVKFDAAGNAYVADSGNRRIRMIDTAGNVTTYAGTGAAGSANGPRLTATFTTPRAIAIDVAGNMYVADTVANNVRRISAAGIVTTLAGGFNSPEGITVDLTGTVFVSDTGGHVIKKVTPGGLVSIIGGSGVPGDAPGVGTAATFNLPRGIAIRPDGNLVIANSGAHTIRESVNTVSPNREKAVVLNYPNSGPVVGGAAGNGGAWVSRIVTNNVFGVDRDDRFNAVLTQNENGTNYIYVTGASGNIPGTNKFFMSKARTNGAGIWIAQDNPAALPQFSATNRFHSFGMALASLYTTNIVAVGYTNGALSVDFPYLVIVSTNGTVNLGRTNPAAGRYHGVTVLNSNIFAVGTSSTNTGGSNIVDKYTLNGTFVDRLSVKLSPLQNDTLFGVTGAGCSGRLYAVGVRSNAVGTSDGILLEINPGLTATAGTMSILTTNIVSVTGNPANAATAVTTDGNDLYVTGHTYNGSERDMFLFRYRIKNWYQPEESLRQFIGDTTRVTNGAVINGAWSLEIWDNRISNALPVPPRVMCWNLTFSYAPVGTPAGLVVSGGVITPLLLSTGPQYLSVQTPGVASRATNTITASGPVTVVYNLNGVPVPGANGNVTLQTFTNGGTFVLGTGGVASFKAGQRYYLGILPGEGASTGTIKVNFDQEGLPPVPSLGNGILTSGSLVNGAGMDYWQFNVPPGASATLFELTPAGGNLDLYVRKANTGFPPSAQLDTTQFDYRSINLGTRTDQILLVPGTGFVPLSSGVWYVGVGNADSRPVAYNLRATSYGGTPYSVVPVVTGVASAGTTPPGNAPSTMFKLTVPAGTPSALFQVTSLTGGGDLIVRRGAYPTRSTNDFFSTLPGTALETVVVRTNATVAGLGGDWFFGVVNNDPYHINYSVLARLPTNGLLVSAAPIVLPNAAPPPVLLTNRHFGLDVGTLPGEKYRVEYTTNFINWIALGTYVSPANGSLSFVHTNALTNRTLYYRILQVP